MRTKRFLDRIADSTNGDGIVECTVCGTSYEEEPRNCHACGNAEFVAR